MGSCTSSTSGEGGEGEVETDTADTTVQQDAAGDDQKVVQCVIHMHIQDGCKVCARACVCACVHITTRCCVCARMVARS